MENLPLDRKRAIEELEKGRELASRLRRVIQGSNGGDDDKTTPFAQDLAEKVERSFSNTLLLLNLRGYDCDDVVSQMQHQLTDSSCLVPAKSAESEDSCKSTSAAKERRGCYKRRRTSQTWEKDSETPIDDGQAWRKYGQKTIMNAKYPRNYFRCTHKFDQGCHATKHVQRIQEEPALYRTTYYGHHTCKRNLLNPEIILNSDSPSDSSVLLSFDHTLPSKQDLPFFSSSSPCPSLPFTKRGCKEEIPSPSSEEYLLSDPELIALSSTLESTHKDVIPEGLYDSVEFNDVFEPFAF